MMKFKVSVIIPVYNVEKYLEECLESVLIQSYKNMEILLIDDGSSDRSPLICDEYAKKDTRIKVIHKSNGGAADARNCGLNISTGEYIIFLDSDDYWDDKDAIKCLIEVVDKYHEVDIVLHGLMFFIDSNGLKSKVINRNEFNLNLINGKDKNDILSYLIRSGAYLITSCDKLVRRDVLIKNSILFEEGRTVEDFDWCLNLTLHINHIYAVNKTFYQCRLREGSVTAITGVKNTWDLFYMIDKWNQILNKIDIDEELRHLLLGYCCYQYCILMGHLYKYDYSVRKKLLKDVFSLKHLLKYDVNYKTHMVIKIYRALGFNLTCMVLRFYMLMKKRGYKY